MWPVAIVMGSTEELFTRRKHSEPWELNISFMRMERINKWRLVKKLLLVY